MAHKNIGIFFIGQETAASTLFPGRKGALNVTQDSKWGTPNI